MNLRVDLMEPDERRSASLINLKSLIRIAWFAVPAIVILLIAVFIINTTRISSELALLEREWEAAKPRRAEASALRSELAVNRNIVAELAGWTNSRIAWHSQLSGLMTAVPPTIQLRALRVDQRLQLLDKEGPARFFSMALDGRSVGDTAEQSVQLLRRRLTEIPVFTGKVQTVTVAKFGADPAPGADRTDRTFTLQCAYLPRLFE
ncbi:MAG: hypothetical protein JW951_09310 [Lentisphaerae bacterium]|nr:hypothetical protein [Lentisphaerota bacterium]